MILNPPAPLQPVMAVVRQLARQFKGGLVDQAKQLFRKPSKRTPLSESFRAELNQFFAADVAETSELLGRDLNHWVGGCQQSADQSTGQDARSIQLQVAGG